MTLGDVTVEDPDVFRTQPLRERADQVVVKVDAPGVAQIDFATRAAIRVGNGYLTGSAPIGREHVPQAGARRGSVADQTHAAGEAIAGFHQRVDVHRAYAGAQFAAAFELPVRRAAARAQLDFQHQQLVVPQLLAIF